MLSFTNLKRHMKTVHNEDTGKRWICNSCGKASQSEKRLIRHETLHRSGDCDDQKIYSCNDCDYRTIVERYLVDHKKTQHTSSGNGQFICVSGKCSKKPNIFKNQRQLDMHKTCHQNVKCDECGKEFGAKRNLKRHKKVKHETFQKDRSQNSNTSVGDGNGNDADVPADRDDPLNDATFVVDQVRVPIDAATFVIV